MNTYRVEITTNTTHAKVTHRFDVDALEPNMAAMRALNEVDITPLTQLRLCLFAEHVAPLAENKIRPV